MPDIAWYNPPFDMRIATLPSNSGKVIKRGYMVTSGTSIAKDAKGFAGKGIRFLYNPSDLTLDYSADMTRFPTSVQPGSALYVSSQIGSCAFELLFDRTYELWTRNGSGIQYNAGGKQSPIDTPELGSMIGVLADINAFRYLTGILPDPALGLNDTKDIGPPLPVPFYVNFGEPEGTGLANLALGIHGYIASMNIKVTHWASDLVPMRAVVSLQMNMTTKESSIDPEMTSTNAEDPYKEYQDSLDPSKPNNQPGDGELIPGVGGTNQRGGR